MKNGGILSCSERGGGGILNSSLYIIEGGGGLELGWFEPTQGHVSSLISSKLSLCLLDPVRPK